MLRNVCRKFHISRLLGGSFLHKDENGNLFAQATGFLSKPKDNGKPSYNCLEKLADERDAQIKMVREVQRLQFGAKAKFAVLNVNDVLTKIETEIAPAKQVSVVYDPLEATAEYPEDPSHCVMTNIPEKTENLSPYDELYGDLIAECVIEFHNARD